MLAETQAPIGGKEVSLGAYQAHLASRRQLSGRDILIESHFDARVSLGMVFEAPGSHPSRVLWMRVLSKNNASGKIQRGN
jgi:hypothetical protein